MATKTAMIQKPPAKPKKVYTQEQMACTDVQLAGILQSLANDRPYTILTKEWKGQYCEWTVLFTGDFYPSHVINIGDKWLIKPTKT